MKEVLKKINTYLFYALALFPVLDFAILNILTGVFIVTMPFSLKTFSGISKKKVWYIAGLFVLSLLPALTSNFQCDIGYWAEKILPLYIITLLGLVTPKFISPKNYTRFVNIYIVGVVLYVFRFAAIVLLEAYRGNLWIVFEKKFVFYSDIMNLLRSEIDVLDSSYHKPYMSLILLLALYFVTQKFLTEPKRKVLHFSLILFFLAAVVFPLSLPNIGLVVIYVGYLIYTLFKQRKILLSSSLLIGTAAIVFLFFYKSFEHNNIDITEDIGFLIEAVNGADQEATSSQPNPRKIIYSALLDEVDEVPLLGFGYCHGKQTVTSIVESRIIESNTDNARSNVLVDSEAINSHLWQRNGVTIEAVDAAFLVSEEDNDCLAHTWFQTLEDLEQDAVYTFSVSVKSETSDVVIRLGRLNEQMAIFDISEKQWSYLGKDLIGHSIEETDDGYYRLGITTNITEENNNALLGFIGENNAYNHCQNKAELLLKQPQVEKGARQTAYNIGFSKNERNILGAKINAHNVFLQEYYYGGILAVVCILMLYGWFLYLARTNGDRLMFVFVLTVLFNSLFEYIQFRQMGISIIIVVSILLMFKKKE